ncbi:MAG TPA: Hsp20/alpha crystallin family protein [Thermoanaerobaculia bacterium]|nr:Hsp20/alpha crystallin family protein [Thermoanaerobaculia bacterium]
MDTPVKTEVTRYNPLMLLDDLRADFEQLWEKPWLPLFNKRFRDEKTPWMPKVDVFTKDNQLVVKAELPGLKKEDVFVTLEDGNLVLKGERKEEKEVKEENFYRMERSYGSFYRRLPLSFKVDPAKIAAKFTDGVLEVLVPMPVVEGPKPLTIAVN